METIQDWKWARGCGRRSKEGTEAKCQRSASIAYLNKPMASRRFHGTNKENQIAVTHTDTMNLFHQNNHSAPSLPSQMALSKPRLAVSLASENLSYRSRSCWLRSGSRILLVCLPHFAHHCSWQPSQCRATETDI